MSAAFHFLSVLVATLLLLLTIGTEGNLFQLCEQLDYYGNLHPFLNCLEYNNYGCWCGLGGGGKPVDAIDSCCKGHDHCYDQVQSRHSKFCLPYFVIYKHKAGKCLDKDDGCAEDTCHCDNALARCVTGKKYHMQYKFQRIKGKCWNISKNINNENKTKMKLSRQVNITIGP